MQMRECLLEMWAPLNGLISDGDSECTLRKPDRNDVHHHKIQQVKGALTKLQCHVDRYYKRLFLFIFCRNVNKSTLHEVNISQKDIC